MKFIIVTGLSGSGKSEAMRALEDMGFYCVDNLPPTLIHKFAELCYQSNSTIDKVALGIDVRGRKFFEALHESLNTLRRDKYPFEVLYLDCADDVLLKRYKMTRRNHPRKRRSPSQRKTTMTTRMTNLEMIQTLTVIAILILISLMMILIIKSPRNLLTILTA